MGITSIEVWDLKKVRKMNNSYCFSIVLKIFRIKRVQYSNECHNNSTWNLNWQEVERWHWQIMKYHALKYIFNSIQWWEIKIDISTVDSSRYSMDCLKLKSWPMILLILSLMNVLQIIFSSPQKTVWWLKKYPRPSYYSLFSKVFHHYFNCKDNNFFNEIKVIYILQWMKFIISESLQSKNHNHFKEKHNLGEGKNSEPLLSLEHTEHIHVK